MPGCHGTGAQRVEVRHHLEVAVAELPRRHRVAARPCSCRRRRRAGSCSPPRRARRPRPGSARAVRRLPCSRPCMSVNASRTVSIEPSCSTLLLQLVEVHGRRNVSSRKLERQLDEPPPGLVLASRARRRRAAARRGSAVASRGAMSRRCVEDPGADGGERGGAERRSRRRRRARPARRSRRPAARAAGGSFVSPPSTRSDVDGHRLADRADDVGDAPGDALERGARDVRARGAGGEAGDRAARVGPPPRRADAGDAREHRARRRRCRAPRGERAERGRLGREAELAAQPLEHLARREHAAVERVLGRAADAPGDGGEEAAGRLGHLVADVGEHEHAGAVGGLHAAGRRRRRRPPARPAGRPRGRSAAGRCGQRSCRSVPSSPTLSRDLGQRVGGHAEALAQPRRPSRGRRAGAAACARRSRRRWRSRRRACR